jgi:hypothetical protein
MSAVVEGLRSRLASVGENISRERRGGDRVMEFANTSSTYGRDKGKGLILKPKTGRGGSPPTQEASVHETVGCWMVVPYSQHLGTGHPPLLRVMLARYHTFPFTPSLSSNFWFRVTGLGLFKVRVSSGED